MKKSITSSTLSEDEEKHWSDDFNSWPTANTIKFRTGTVSTAAAASVASAKTTTAPSAGVVTIKFVFDGSLLAPDSQQGRVVMHAWSSLNRIKDNSALEWSPGTHKTLSKEATITLPLHDEYVHSERNASGYELGNMRTDANVWIEAMAEEPSTMNKAAVYGRTGAACINTATLAEFAAKRSANSKTAPLQFPLVLFGHIDPTTQSNFVKGHIIITDVSFGKDTKKIIELHKTNRFVTSSPSPFELNDANYPFIDSITETVIERGLYDAVNEQNITMPGTWPVNSRIRMPWMQTHQPRESSNRLPMAAFYTDARALNPLPSDGPEDEAYLLNVFTYAFKRQNMTPTEATTIMNKQLARTDAQYDPKMNVCVANIARGFTLVSTTFPYQADFRNLAKRADKFNGGAVAAQNDTSKIVADESLDYAQLKGGGDCEDTTRFTYMHAKMLARGTWKSPFLQAIQKVAGFYNVVMMLGSVTSPALEGAHDASKTAAHLHDAKRHHHILKASNGTPETHLSRSSVVQILHNHSSIGSPEEMRKEVGGHSWSEMIPKHKMIEFLSRLVPQTRDASVSPIFNRNGPADRAWKYRLPHLVLESTGLLNPMTMPAVYYACDGENRDSIRKRSLGAMATFHTLIANSPLFHSLKSEAQPTSTVNTPGQRITEFYVQSTQAFTDEYLDKTGAVAFNWIQLGPPTSPIVSAAVAAEQSTPDPLFEKSDVLTAEKIKHSQTRFMHTAGITTSATAKNAAVAFSIEDHEKELQTLAVGALVGEGSVKSVDPTKLTIGVDLEARIQDRPYASNVALIPIGAMTPIEARVLASQMRQLPPDEPPSRQLSMFATGADVEFVRQSLEDLNKADAQAMARLCSNKKLVDEQRARVAGIGNVVTKLFADRPWLNADEALEENLHLQTFYFRPHELVSDSAIPGVYNELSRFRESGIIYTARFYVEEATQNFKTAVIQLLCKEPSDSKVL